MELSPLNSSLGCSFIWSGSSFMLYCSLWLHLLQAVLHANSIQLCLLIDELEMKALLGDSRRTRQAGDNSGRLEGAYTMIWKGAGQAACNISS